jgi:hypothetical protein
MAICVPFGGAGIKGTSLDMLAVMWRIVTVLAAGKSRSTLQAKLRQSRFDHFKVPIQVVFGDLAGGWSGELPIRRYFSLGYIRILHARHRDLPLYVCIPIHGTLLTSSTAAIRSFLVANLARPSTKVIRLVHVLVVLPELLRRVGAFDAHAARHGHFGTVRLCLRAIGDRERDAGVVIGRIETGDQIECNKAVHVTPPPTVVRQIEIKAMARRAEVRDRRNILTDLKRVASQREQR